MSLIVMADREDQVDMTPQAISQRTGAPLEVVKEALEFLSQPDPESRSKACEGRRIVLIDPNRNWGWKIVNRDTYKKIRDQGERADYFKEQKRKQRARPPVSTTCPPSVHHTAPQAVGSKAVEIQKNKTAAPRVLKEITEEQIEAASQRFKLPVETVRILADKILLEFDSRKYRSAPSALLTWCQREAKNPMLNGSSEPSDPYGAAMFAAGDDDD